VRCIIGDTSPRVWWYADIVASPLMEWIRNHNRRSGVNVMPRWDDNDDQSDDQPIDIGALRPPLEGNVANEEETRDMIVATDQLEQAHSGIKVGILGGKGVGKSYLFQAMVYRAANPVGALAYYTRNKPATLWHSGLPDRNGRALAFADFLEAYRDWRRLPATTLASQGRYTLSLNFATGVLGASTSVMDIEFLDASGEMFEMGLATAKMRDLWNLAVGDATVMLFCLPIWALFPNSGEMRDEDWDMRDRWLHGFSRVLTTYREIRKPRLKVRSVLVLTMSDDHRCALRTLRRRWIEPYQKDEGVFLSKTRQSSGIQRYLQSAREVSEYLYREIRRIDFEGLFQGPEALDFGHGLPWIIPVSVMDGEQLDVIETERSRNPGYNPRGRRPIPAHVELPLLAALWEHHNALM
jgi:hypothetical protein